MVAQQCWLSKFLTRPGRQAKVYNDQQGFAFGAALALPQVFEAAYVWVEATT
jgi:hypothetical protein